MARKIRAFIRADLHWMLAALGLAVFVWLLSMAILDPEQNELYRRELFFYNPGFLENENVVLLNEDELPLLVSVGVRGNASLHNALTEAEIRPSIDFRAVSVREVHAADGPIEVTLPIRVSDLPPGFVLHHITPPEITVLLDARVRTTFPLTIVEMGQPQAQTELQRITTANQFITLVGARSIMHRVERVIAEANLFGLNETVTHTVRTHAIDRYGENISDLFEFNITETQMIIEIYPLKRVPITPLLTGTLAEGFAVAHYSTNPPYVYLVGTAQRLEEVEYVAPVFDINNENTDFERVFLINEALPEGVRLARNQLAAAHFQVAVEPILERAFIIPRGSIGVFGGTNYTVIDDPARVIVNVSGPASLMEELTVTDITVNLNLHYLLPGMHRVPLQIVLPPDLQAVEPVPVLVIRVDDPYAPPPAAYTPDNGEPYENGEESPPEEEESEGETAPPQGD